MDNTETKQKKGKKNNKKRLKMLIVALAFLIAGVGVFVSMRQTEETNWTEERLYKEKEIEFSILDNSVIEGNKKLEKWRDDNVEMPGVYAIQDGEFTYIMVAAGKQEDKGHAVQLYDIRTGMGKVFVGYNILTPKDITIENGSQTPNMLARIKKTDKKVVGRNITEDTENDLSEEASEE